MSKNNARDKELMKQSETECGFDSDKFADLIREDEREECAKVAEDMSRAVLAMLNVTSQPKALAAAIRARGNT